LHFLLRRVAALEAQDAATVGERRVVGDVVVAATGAARGVAGGFGGHGVEGAV